MDKTTLKAWFTRGKKPTAAQFAAWMDSYWHKDEQLPVDAVGNLIDLLDEKAVIDDAHTSTATTYSSERIMQLIDTITGALEPEKDVVAVETIDELYDIETPSGEVLYLVADENVLYRWDGTTFVRVEADNTIYIRNLSDLDDTTEVRDYNVVWTQQINTNPVRYAASSWMLSVDKVSSNILTQYLTNRDGYYYRTYENGRWGVWVERQYAYISDVETIIATTNKTYTIDLAKDCEQALDWNINGSISITSIRARNVCALDYFLGDDTPVSLELTLQDDGSYLWEGNIDVDDQTLITWVVTKADDGVAALGINYQ